MGREGGLQGGVRDQEVARHDANLAAPAEVPAGSVRTTRRGGAVDRGRFREEPGEGAFGRVPVGGTLKRGGKRRDQLSRADVDRKGRPREERIRQRPNRRPMSVTWKKGKNPKSKKNNTSGLMSDVQMPIGAS